MTYDATFHDMVADLGGNQLARETLARLRSHLHMYRLYHHAGQAAATKPEHVAVARAIAAHDPEAAAVAMQRPPADRTQPARRGVRRGGGQGGAARGRGRRPGAGP